METPQKQTKAEKRELRKLEWQKEAEKAKKAEQYKKIGIWVLVAVIIMAAIFGLAMLVNSPTSTTSTSNLTVPLKADQEFSRGDVNSKVTLIEYGDFQCPACAQYHPLVKQLLSEQGDKMHFVYRYFPLTNVHQNAQISSQAGFAANKQGKYWEMHDTLYDTQNDWAQIPNPQDIFVGYAKDLGLNTDQFKNDMNSDEANKFVNDSLKNATNLGLNSTPSFFLNGKYIETPNTYDDLKKLIDNEFSKK